MQFEPSEAWNRCKVGKSLVGDSRPGETQAIQFGKGLQVAQAFVADWCVLKEQPAEVAVRPDRFHTRIGHLGVAKFQAFEFPQAVIARPSLTLRAMMRSRICLYQGVCHL